MVRYFNNNSGGDIDVNEVALVVNQPQGGAEFRIVLPLASNEVRGEERRRLKDSGETAAVAANQGDPADGRAKSSLSKSA